MASNNKYDRGDDEAFHKNGRRERKNKKRSSRHNMKIMIDKVNHGLIDSTDLDEYLEEEYNDNY